MWQNVWQDLRFGVRMLARDRGFTAVALVVLALGIGANAAIFSLVNALFLQTLPVPNASGLVHVYQTRQDRSEFYPLSLIDYAYYRDHATTLGDVAAHYPTSPMHVVTADASEPVTGSVVTEGYFRVLGLTPAAGRFFVTDEDRVPDRDPVAVISHSFWRRRFDANPNIAGIRVDLNGMAFTIVGVAPAGFAGVLVGGSTIDVWIPAAMFRVGYRYCDAFSRGCAVVQVLGRLKPEHRIEDAQTELSALAGRLRAAYPDVNSGLDVAVVPARGAHPAQRSAADRPVRLLLVAVAFVLLIACANLAALLLARGLRRRREIAIRLALGAGRGRVARQLVVEGILLSLVGGLLGLLVASWAKDILLAYYATDYAGRPMNFSLPLDPVVLGATLGLSVLTGVVFSVVPALQASRPDLVPVLKDDGAAGGWSRSRLRDALVIAQLAASIVLLVLAGLLVRSLATIYRGPGFDPGPVVLLRVRPSLVGHEVPKARAFQRATIERLEAVPGVVSASPSDYFPFFGSAAESRVWLPGQAPARDQDALRVPTTKVGPRYFQTLGAPLLTGREFDDQDRKGAPDVAIVNEVLALRYWPRGTAAGRMLMVDGREYRVVGVVSLVPYFNLSEEARPCLFLSYWQHETADTWDADSRTVVRVAGDPSAMMPLLRREIAAVDRQVPISEDYPLTERLRHHFKPLLAARTMLASFGTLAILLSAVGLYGALAFAVAQRSREIAIRVAIGADRAAVAGLIVRHGLIITAAGVAAGVGGALFASRLLATLLYGISRHDSLTFIAVSVVLSVVALLATFLPARRAMHLDPMIVLRSE